MVYNEEDDPKSVRERLSSIEDKLDSLIATRDDLESQLKNVAVIIFIGGSIAAISALLKSCS